MSKNVTLQQRVAQEIHDGSTACIIQCKNGTARIAVADSMPATLPDVYITMSERETLNVSAGNKIYGWGTGLVSTLTFA